MAVKISALANGTALTGTEQFETVQGGVSVKTTANQMKTFANQEKINFQAVGNGFTVSFGVDDDAVILSNGASVSSGTVNLPTTPVDGKLVHISSDTTVNTLTIAASGGATISGAPTTISATTPMAFIYSATNAKWYRIV